MDISSNKMKVKQKQESVFLEGDVKIQDVIRGSQIKAKKIVLRRDKVSEKIRYLKADGSIEVYDIEIKLVGEHGEYDNQLNSFKMAGGITLFSLRYYIIAEKIEFNLNKNEGKVVALPDEQIHLTYLHRPKKNPLESRLVNVRCGEILFTQQGRKIVLQKQVEINDPLDNTHIFANRVELFLNERKEVEEMICSGNFRMNQKGRTSSARQAHFLVGEQTLSLFGNAYVKEQNSFELRSENIRMYFEVSKGIITGAEKKPLRIKIPLKK